MEVVTHTLAPVYDQSSRVLLLGTMPSPKSREYGFYYSHPQNRFWRVLSALFQEPLPQGNAAKEALVRSHHIALWDVLASCEIQGADDASIRRPVATICSLFWKRRRYRPSLPPAKKQRCSTTGFVSNRRAGKASICPPPARQIAVTARLTI